jgi:polysaccharide biosynthesis protein PslG
LHIRTLYPRRLASVAAVLAALLAHAGTAWATSCPSVNSTPARQPAGTLYGVHMNLNSVDPGDRGRSLANARDILHAQVGRNNLMWSRIEPQQGHFDWSAADYAVNAQVGAGIEPLMVLVGSPPWANNPPASSPDQASYVPEGDAAFDRWVQAYSSFAATAAARYKGKVRHWEIWNEENGRFTWLPRPNPERYARFYSSMRAAIKSADPGAKVALGGLNNLTAGHPDTVLGTDFLKRVYAAGVQPDYVAVHPYSSKSQAPDEYLQFENNFDDMQAIQAIVKANRPVPLWVTEWGWSEEAESSGGWTTNGVDRPTQAKYVYCSLNLLARTYTYVTVATYFLDFDRNTFKHGLFDSDFRPKPSALAFGKWMLGPNPPRSSNGSTEGGIDLDGDGIPDVGPDGAPLPGGSLAEGVTDLSLSPPVFRNRRARRASRPFGTYVRFHVPAEGRVNFRLERAYEGKRTAKGCVRTRKRVRGVKRCFIWKRLPIAFSRWAAAGRNKVRFVGRRGKPLAVGNYLIVATYEGTPGVGQAFFVTRR